MLSDHHFSRQTPTTIPNCAMPDTANYKSCLLLSSRLADTPQPSPSPQAICNTIAMRIREWGEAEDEYTGLTYYSLCPDIVNVTGQVSSSSRAVLCYVHVPYFLWTTNNYSQRAAKDRCPCLKRPNFTASQQLFAFEAVASLRPVLHDSGPQHSTHIMHNAFSV
ncbi:hypothetical protein BC827DRAFT_79052 [Russula dissimulans]|nr:hypothetical protein BC827DRAFT_79052 [Russula dissimulans]